MKSKTILISILTVILAFSTTLFAQEQEADDKHNVTINGLLLDADLHPVSDAVITLQKESEIITSTTSNQDGSFTISDVHPDAYLLLVQHPALETGVYQALIELSVDENFENKIFQIVIGATDSPLTAIPQEEVDEEVLPEEEVQAEEEEIIVITGTLTGHTIQNAPVRTLVIERDRINLLDTNSLAETLNFCTGLRVENNCQNCNFTQLRINGLSGQYSQILIDSLPVFSTLAGVYGLEQIPAEMIERLEIIKGGASALYSGNAVGGVVNVITRMPTGNFLNLNYNHAFLESGEPILNVGTSIGYLSDSGNAGGVFFGSFQYRNPYDANDDGLSEIGKLRNIAVGGKLFFTPMEDSLLSLSFHNIQERRKGGNYFEQPDHEADVTESTSTLRYGGDLVFEHQPLDFFKYKVYAGFGYTVRDSYYGAEGGGIRDLTDPADLQNMSDEDADTFLTALKSYGYTENPLWLTGLNLFFPFEGLGEHTISFGIEYKEDYLNDTSAAYGTTAIDDKYANFGAFIQEEWTILEDLIILVGLRLDKHSEVESLIISPRASVKYSIIDELVARVTFSSGYKPPVVFDEDLHITQVGGESSYVVNDPDLKEEKAYSISGGLDYINYIMDDTLGLRGAVNGFYSILSDMHSFEVLADPDAVVLQRINAGEASVYGGDIEIGVMIGEYLEFDMGLTIQDSKFDEDEELGIDADAYNLDPNTDTVVTSSGITRTPNAYGFFILIGKYLNFDLILSAVITGSMDIPHIVGENDDGEEIVDLVKTNAFFDLNITLGYTIQTEIFGTDSSIKLYAGIKNVLNSFQDDFDIGIERDAGYTYGPIYPRNYYFGTEIKF